MANDFDVCFSSKRINNPFPNCDASGQNCNTPPKFYFSNKNSNLCTNGQKLEDVVLQEGINNFNRVNKSDGAIIKQVKCINVILIVQKT